METCSGIWWEFEFVSEVLRKEGKKMRVKKLGPCGPKLEWWIGHVNPASSSLEIQDIFIIYLPRYLELFGTISMIRACFNHFGQLQLSKASSIIRTDFDYPKEAQVFIQRDLGYFRYPSPHPLP